MKMNQSREKKYDSSINLALTRGKLSESISESDKFQLQEEIKVELKKQNAILITHYYVDSFIQDLTIATGGIVSDSLEMARFGKNNPAQTLVVSGVKFMGETAKILSPSKRILMSDIEAECSLDLGCPSIEFTKFCDQNPTRTVVVYANTSAKVKAISDWTVTSSCAVDIVRSLSEQGKSLIFAPDRHLGDYIKNKTGADMLIWDGHCIVHDEFKAFELKEMKNSFNDNVLVLVHPESPKGVIELADFVGSTSQMLNFSKKSTVKKFIVATDGGLLHLMRKASPEKLFYEAPTAGKGATCKSCAYCPWMSMNSLKGILNALRSGDGEIQVPKTIINQAKVSLTRMLDFTKKNVQRN